MKANVQEALEPYEPVNWDQVPAGLKEEGAQQRWSAFVSDRLLSACGSCQPHLLRVVSAILVALGVGVAASRYLIAELFTHAENVFIAADGFFRVADRLRIHGLFYGIILDLPGWGKAALPLLTSLLRLAIALVGGVVLQLPDAELDRLYFSVAAALVEATTTLAVIFVLRPPMAAKKPVSG